MKTVLKTNVLQERALKFVSNNHELLKDSIFFKDNARIAGSNLEYISENLTFNQAKNLSLDSFEINTPDEFTLNELDKAIEESSVFNTNYGTYNMMSLEFGGLSAEMVISVLSDTISVRYSIYALFNNELGQEEYELIDDIHILNHPEKVYGDLVKYSLTQDDKYLEKYFEEMFEYVKGINNSCIAI